MYLYWFISIERWRKLNDKNRNTLHFLVCIIVICIRTLGYLSLSIKYILYFLSFFFNTSALYSMFNKANAISLMRKNKIFVSVVICANHILRISLFLAYPQAFITTIIFSNPFSVSILLFLLPSLLSNVYDNNLTFVFTDYIIIRIRMTTLIVNKHSLFKTDVVVYLSRW